MQISTQSAPATLELYSHCGIVVETSGVDLVLESFDGIIRSYRLTDHTAIDGQIGAPRHVMPGDTVRIAAEVREGFAIAVSINSVRAQAMGASSRRPNLYRIK